MIDALSPDDLILSAQTTRDAAFRERVEAAAAAGFAGLGLRPADFERDLASGLSVADMRSLLAANGLRVAELEVLRDWALGGEAGARSRGLEDRLYRIADALGGRHLIAVSGLPEGGVDEAAERFAAVCVRAAERGLLVALEFLPWTTIPDPTTAFEVVRRAGAANGGVLVDPWHHFRGSADDARLRALPAAAVNALHMDDATAAQVGEVLDDTLHRRRLPGEGEFDLVGFVRTLDAMGVRAPFGVEVMSDELDALPPAEAARRAADSTRSVLARARAGS